MRHRLPLLLSSTLLCSAALAQAPDEVKEGLWEISLQGEIGGQPLTATPMVVRQCITQTTARDLMNQLNGTVGGCQVSNLTQVGPTGRWTLKCTGQIEINGTGELTMGADSFSGSMNMFVAMAGQTLPMIQRFEARWTGPCR
jgi:hypothetical protein